MVSYLFVCMLVSDKNCRGVWYKKTIGGTGVINHPSITVDYLLIQKFFDFLSFRLDTCPSTVT